MHLRSGVFVFIRIVFSPHDSSLRCSGEEQTALCAPPGAGSNVDTGRGSSGAFSFLVRPVTPPLLSWREPPVFSSSLPSDCLFASALPNLKGPSCAKGDCLPVNMQLLHCFHPSVIFLFYLSLDLHTFFYPSSQWCCTIVCIVCKKLFTHLIEHCVPLLNWHQTASRQPRQLWILQSLNNSSEAAAQVTRGSACLFLFIPYLHHFTPRLSNMRCSGSSIETSALFSCTDTEG